MVWTKDTNPHESIELGLENLHWRAALAFLRNGLIAGILVGAAVGWWHRNDFNPAQHAYDSFQEARQRDAALKEQQCREFPNSAICKPKGEKK